MKKSVLIFLVVILAGSGIWYFKVHKQSGNPDNASYRDENIGIAFIYPKTLKVTATADTITIRHDVPFEHHDYCDFKGEATTTVPNLTDFDLTLGIEQSGLIDAMKAKSPYIPEENFVNGQVVPSPGFIDPVAFGALSGYKIFEGAEGCGHTVYYFPVSDDRTLVATEEWVTVFSGAIDADNKAAAEAVPGVIDGKKEAAILDGILGSLKIQ
jgi:hypothetical protein